MKEYVVDERRRLIVPGDREATVAYAAHHFLQTAQEAIAKRGSFSVALSGGSTPKQVYQLLPTHPLSHQVDWNRVYLFWSDERSVPPTHPDSNYSMAMTEFKKFPIPEKQIFRMHAEEDLERNALAYEQILAKALHHRPLDLILLGVGEEGHTASLFPHTSALEVQKRNVVPNFIPTKASWRMTFTREWINRAYTICFYALGRDKAAIINTLFTAPLDPLLYPAQAIGTQERPALWLLDSAACEKFLSHIK